MAIHTAEIGPSLRLESNGSIIRFIGFYALPLRIIVQLTHATGIQMPLESKKEPSYMIAVRPLDLALATHNDLDTNSDVRSCASDGAPSSIIIWMVPVLLAHTMRELRP